MADPITLIDLVGLSTYTGFVEQKSVPITWSAYQALPTAQKNNGTSYYITDKGVIYKNSTEYGAGEANVQSDWNQTTTTADDYIKNKPTALSDFTNDTNFITNAVNDLTNYYTKSSTYTQSEVNALVSAIPKFSIEIVDSLLIEDPSTTTIYLLRNQTSQSQNLYTEYIYVVPETGDPFFEKLGEQTINFKPEALGIGIGACSTAAATAAKEATLQDFVLTKNGIVAVKFTNAVPANATLNVNSTGAKSILFKGLAIVADVIKAGDLATFVYDGTYYQIISIDSGTSGGGHTIENASGTDMTQRDTLQFSGYLRTSDDSTSDKTVVTDAPEHVEWSVWQTMTTAQKTGHHWLIDNAPVVDGSIDADLMTLLWENQNPTASFAAQEITGLTTLGDYDLFLIVTNINYVIGKNTIYAENVYPSTSASEGSVSQYRQFVVNSANNKIVIGDGYRGSTGNAKSTDNTNLIPLAIYGIKTTVSFDIAAVAGDISTSADKCMLSDGVTSVEDRITATNIVQYIDVSTYTSSNPYVTGSDGYLRLHIASDSNLAYVNGVALMGTDSGGPTNVYFCLFVRKGSRVYLGSQNTNAQLRFYPLS